MKKVHDRDTKNQRDQSRSTLHKGRGCFALPIPVYEALAGEGTAL